MPEHFGPAQPEAAKGAAGALWTSTAAFTVCPIKPSRELFLEPRSFRMPTSTCGFGKRTAERMESLAPRERCASAISDTQSEKAARLPSHIDGVQHPHDCCPDTAGILQTCSIDTWSPGGARGIWRAIAHQFAAAQGTTASTRIKRVGIAQASGRKRKICAARDIGGAWKTEGLMVSTDA